MAAVHLEHMLWAQKKKKKKNLKLHRISLEGLYGPHKKLIICKIPKIEFCFYIRMSPINDWFVTEGLSHTS